jgi:hypothetical protein
MATPPAARLGIVNAALLAFGLFAATAMAIRLLDAAVSALLQGMGYPPVSCLA